MAATKQNFFGLAGKCDIPNFLKAPGIGNSCNEFLAPNSYKPEGKFDEIKRKLEKDKFERIAVSEWHKRLYEKEKDKNPKRFPQLSSKLIKPGPGAYSAENSKFYKKKAEFGKVNQSSFGVDDPRKIYEVNDVEHPNVYVPGPGTYSKIKYDKKKQDHTSNFMSQTERVLNGQPLHSGKYPSATQYDTMDFDSIKSPMVNGGAPANLFAFIKHQEWLQDKRANPFRTSDLSHEKSVEIELANVGPGMHFPEKDEIGGSTLERQKREFYSKTQAQTLDASRADLTATKSKNDFAQKRHSATIDTNINSNSSILSSVPMIKGTNPNINKETSLGFRSFASSNMRFASGNVTDKRNAKLPGPGNYYGNSSVTRSPLNHLGGMPSEMNILDEQWNNKSRSLKYNNVLNAHMGLTQAAKRMQVAKGFFMQSPHKGSPFKMQHSNDSASTNQLYYGQ